MRTVGSSRGIRFLIGGGVAALFNLILIAILIEQLGFDTPWLRNVANAIAIELSLLFSFIIYRIWVWPGSGWSLKNLLFRQLPLYHVAAGLAILSRTLIVFPLLDRMGVSYGVNTLLGALLSAGINYSMSDRLVFKRPNIDGAAPDRGHTDLYPPEGLSAGNSNLEKVTSQNHPGHSPAHQPPDNPPTQLQKPLQLSIVIPAYNEEGCIASTLEDICTCLDRHQVHYDILVVNDNSKDRTETILKQVSQQHPQIQYINNTYPNGFGFAVRCGLENFKGDAVTIVMADASDPPECIVDYYQALNQGADCVFGSRFMRGGKVYDYPQHKLFINRLANLFVKTLFNLKYNDTTNAFKAYRREVIEDISPLISHHFNLTVEMPLKAMIRGYSPAIVPIRWHNRQTGVSKLKIKEMGSRYLFIVLYLFSEKMLSQGDYVKRERIVKDKTENAHLSENVSRSVTS